MNRRLTRIALAAALGLTASIGFASSAMRLPAEHDSANSGPSLGPFGGEWVELQMYADGQNLVSGKVDFAPSIRPIS